MIYKKVLNLTICIINRIRERSPLRVKPCAAAASKMKLQTEVGGGVDPCAVYINLKMQVICCGASGYAYGGNILPSGYALTDIRRG